MQLWLNLDQNVLQFSVAARRTYEKDNMCTHFSQSAFQDHSLILLQGLMVAIYKKDV